MFLVTAAEAVAVAGDELAPLVALVLVVWVVGDMVALFLAGQEAYPTKWWYR